MLKRFTDLYLRSFRGLKTEVWLLALVMLINRSGMMVLPFLSLFLTQELGWSKFETGIATSCFGLGSITGSYLGGILTDRVGTMSVLKMSLLSGGACFFLFLFVSGFYPLCFLIFLTTTLGDAFRPALFTAVQEKSEDENLTRGISLVRLAINLGISIGPAVGGFLAAAYGYKWLFILDGTTCIIAGLAVFVLFNESKPLQRDKLPQKVNKIASPYSDRTFLLFLVSNLIMLVVFFQILFSVPVYFREVYMLDETMIGWFFTANGLIIFLFEMPIIYVLEKRWDPFKSMTLGVIMMGLGFLSLFFFKSIVTAIILFTLLVSFGEIINFPFISTVSLRRASEENKGRYMGATTVLFSVAFMAAPLLGLPIIQLIGYENYWVAGVIFMGFAIVGYRYLSTMMGPKN